jgi:site-specific DNA recombinase
MKKLRNIPSSKTEHEKKRVAAYCRVSTERDDQADSFEVQIKYYDDYIHNNPDWEFAGVYADRGISGTDAKNRPEFQRMIADALDGKIDLILCKSISRFSRSLKDCVEYVQKMQKAGIEIRFEKEGISTKDPNAFLVFGIMATIAQSESESISRNMRWSCQRRFEKGEYSLGNGRFPGYGTKPDGTIYITEDAWIIRMIFERFLAGDSYREIAKKVADAGGQIMRSGKELRLSAIHRILTNEIYVGDKLLQKRPPKDYLTHKPNPSIEYASYYVTNGHPAIIDRETWNRVQKKLKERKADRNAGIFVVPGKSHFLFGKIYCGNCGALYKRRNSGSGEHTHKRWCCEERRKGKNGNGCKNRTVSEAELLSFINLEFGLRWNGTETLDPDMFQKYVARITVYPDQLRITWKGGK